MSSGEYPEELVELVRHAALKALATGGEHAIGPAVLGALAGRLVPEGSEREWAYRNVADVIFPYITERARTGCWQARHGHGALPRRRPVDSC